MSWALKDEYEFPHEFEFLKQEIETKRQSVT